MTRHLLFLMLAAILLLACCWTVAAAVGQSASQSSGPTQVYAVNKLVRDFPDTEDLPTPEAACATFVRLILDGDLGGLIAASTARTGDSLRAGPRGSDSKPSEKTVKRYLNARLLEVRKYPGDHAVVIADLGSGSMR